MIKYNWLPLLLIALVLVALNAGLHVRLAPRALPDRSGLPFTDSFSAANLKGWQIRSGTWSVREGRMFGDGSAGGEATAILPLQVSDVAGFRLSMALSLPVISQTVAVVSGIKHGDVTQNSHIVRLTRNEAGVLLSCGYYDLLEIYRNQASVQLPAQESLRLELIAAQNSYALAVDGRRVVQDIPLLYRDGQIALLASGAGSSIDDLTVEAVVPGSR